MTRRRRHRRGFVFLSVLALLLVAGILMVAGMRRTVFRSRVVAEQIESYQRHHEMLSMRDIAYARIRKMDNERLEELAAGGDHSIIETLSDEVTVHYAISDGQGTVLVTNLEQMIDEDERDWLAGVLQRLPADKWDELTRRSGPLEISLRAAPDEVLDAVAGEDTGFARALKAARDEGVEDQGDLVDRLQRYGVAPDMAVETASHFDFEPDLWRIRIEAFNERRKFSALYEIIAELGARPTVREWRQIR